jgi:hypothetical protein
MVTKHSFKVGDRVVIKSGVKAEEMSAQFRKVYQRYVGLESEIKVKYDGCAGLKIDQGYYSWAYQWLEKIPDQLPF